MCSVGSSLDKKVVIKLELMFSLKLKKSLYRPFNYVHVTTPLKVLFAHFLQHISWIFYGTSAHNKTKV